MGKPGPNSKRKRAAGAASGKTAARSPATSSTKASPLTRRAGRNGTTDGDRALKFTIRSDFSAGHEVQKRILDAVERAGFNSQSTFAIKLALEEALINAIKHGNKLDLKKNVQIQVSVSPQTTDITIEDEGPGFDRAGVPDPTLEENLDKCSGRGILLIEAYMNRVEWSHGGRRVHMVKKNEADLLPR